MSTIEKLSQDRLKGVNPALVEVVTLADAVMRRRFPDMWFRVTEGLRTQERQRQLVAAGLSDTMNSNHLIGRAVDLAAMVVAEPVWRLQAYYKVALAVREAAMAKNLPIRWGACWQSLHALQDNEKSLADAVVAYSTRVKRAGGRPLIDGPHFEIAV